MAVLSGSSLSAVEYLQTDSKAERRSEYFGGQMFPVEAATKSHSALTVNLSVAIVNDVRSRNAPCHSYSQSMRVFLPAAGEYAYPDFVLTCGEEAFAPFDTLLNPVLIAEVLSPHTQNYDLGTKFGLYRSIPTLKEYWTIWQDRILVQQWTIREGNWTLIEHSTRQSNLIHHHFEVALDQIYFEFDF